MEKDIIILVDSTDKEIGYETKEKCHRTKPLLHRAFSVFLFNSRSEMLITKRAAGKATWPLFWTNACCSHPRKGEPIESAAHRRIKEELGIDCPLRFSFKFQYEAQYDKDWGESEVDSVFIGNYDGALRCDKSEVSDWKFMPVGALKKDVTKNADAYTPWFKLCFERVLKEVKA